MATVELTSTFIVTASDEVGHVPFEVVQVNTFAPTPKAVTPDVGDAGVVIVPVPDVNVQSPVPMAGVLPANVAVPGVSHTV